MADDLGQGDLGRYGQQQLIEEIDLIPGQSQ